MSTLEPREVYSYLRLMTKLPLLCIWEGVGSRKALFWVSTKNLSSAAATLTGAPSSFHLGSSSVRAWGSSTLPDRMWAPAGMVTNLTQSKLQMIGTAEYDKVAPANASYDVHHIWTYVLLLHCGVIVSPGN